VGAGQQFGDLLRLLAAHGVELVVVGATAAVLDGAPMTTFDLDVVFEPGPANRARLLAALAELDAVIESKEAADRPKHHAALPLLRETLRLRRERGEG
jgi:hypothetical protein